MNSKKRLEDIKSRLERALVTLNRSNGKTHLIDDLFWLVEQAEIGIDRLKDLSEEQEMQS